MSTADGAADRNLGRILLVAARNAVADRLALPRSPEPDTGASDLRQTAATFVTLTRDRALRGCIGSLNAYRPLIEDVRHNAVAAAFADRRFAPLERAEFAQVCFEVSLLTPATALTAPDQAAAIAALRPGIDGVILEYGARRATFLPQVWQTLADAERFLGELKRKAGLPEDFWAAGLKLSRYQVRKWQE